MPDRDIIHSSLPNRFQNFYAQLCEGHWEANEIGYKALYPLKGQLKSYGDSPIELGARIANVLERAYHDQRSGDVVDGRDVCRQIEKLAQGTNGSPRSLDFIVQSGKAVLREIQNDYCSENMRQEVFRKYVDSVWRGDCEDRVQMTQTHHRGASHVEVDKRIREIRPHVNEGIIEYARQIANKGNVTELRRPHRLKHPIGLNEDAW